jgi:hypothetical protein
MSNNTNTLFKAIKQGTYQRLTYPHLIQVVPLNKCLNDIDLLASSITYSLVTLYYDRTEYSWPLIRRCLCNGNNKGIYVSLTFNKPTSLSDLKVTYIEDIQQLNLLDNCSLKDVVLSNLKHIIRD